MYKNKPAVTSKLIILAIPLLLLASYSEPFVAASEQSWYGSGSGTLTATHPDMKWERLIKAAPWGKRAMPRGGLLDGQFYILGGRAGMFRIYGDTWRSPDGVNWEMMSNIPAGRSGPIQEFHSYRAILYSRAVRT